jgi:hypothetical protein
VGPSVQLDSVESTSNVSKGTRFHDLKRFYTSRLLLTYDPKTVQALSRHGVFSLTMDTYARPPQAVPRLTVRAFGPLFIPPGGVEEEHAAA